jgi:hypothetical protein
VLFRKVKRKAFSAGINPDFTFTGLAKSADLPL